MMSGMTIGYTVGAALLWTAGLASTITYVRTAGGGIFEGGPIGLVVPAAIVWTAVIAAYLLWVSLHRADENRLAGALAGAYRLPAPSPAPTAAEPESSAIPEPQEPTP